MVSRQDITAMVDWGGFNGLALAVAERTIAGGHLRDPEGVDQ